MKINGSDLIKYRISSYKSKNSLIEYGQPQIISDEGSIFRIHDLQVISKFGIENIYLENNWIIIIYRNGEKIMLEVTKRNTF